MKKTTILYQMLPAAFAGIFLLSSCASQQDIRKVNLEMHTLDNRLIELEKSIKEIKKRTGSSVESVQEKQAGFGNTIDKLNTELLQTRGQLEEARHRYRSLNAELIRIKKKLNQRLDKVEHESSALNEKFSEKTDSLKGEVRSLNSKLADMQNVIDSLGKSITSLDQQIESIKKAEMEEKTARARKAAKAACAAKEQAEKAGESSEEGVHLIKPAEIKKDIDTDKDRAQNQTAEKKSAGQQEYEKGLKKFRTGNYRETKEIFSDLRGKYAGKDIGIKSRFMVADCLFKLKNYSLAILEYQQVISDHPGHDKVPHALFNQASAFEKLGDKKTADIVYRKLIREFPDSEEAARARKKL